MKRIITFILLTAILLSAFSIGIYADDNATSGDGDEKDYLDGYGWYNYYQYLWKVTVFVGKSDEATTNSDLTSDFHRIGTVIMKKTGWSVSSSVMFGDQTKVDYYDGASLGLASSVNIISDSNCPQIPIVCFGNISTVKSYFGSTGTMSTVLNAIAADYGTTAYGLLSDLTFEIGGVTRSGWSSEYLMPNATTNRVPWVIVYEPMVIMNCKDQVTKLAFTATEFALAQLYGWYDWNHSGGRGQSVANLTHKNLPTSVQLEEPWFGYPVYDVTDSVKWNEYDIILGGGWGMRWMGVSIKEEPPEEPEIPIIPEIPVVPEDTEKEEKEEIYEFSVSGLSVTPSTVYEDESVTVTFRTDSWDLYNAYYNIPVELLYNGRVIYTEYVYYSIYGAETHSYTLNVGSGIGVNEITARVNWYDHYYEDNSYNNETASAYVVVKPKVDLGISTVTPNADYRAGTEVITSFNIHNYSRHDIIPSHNNSVSFEAYYYSGGRKVVISSQIWSNAVIPGFGTNLVYFKWTVPSNIAGNTVYCMAKVNATNSVDEYNVTNNTDTLTWRVSVIPKSQTPDTQYEKEKPSGYRIPSAPSTSSTKATWSMWEYVGSSFVNRTYGVAISATVPTITPDSGSPSSVYKNGRWYMRSGYGVTMSYTPSIVRNGSYLMPSSSAYTGVQSVCATFPEFYHSASSGNYRTLEYSGGKWSFEANRYADNRERLHFTPLWYPDGDYTVSVYASEVWTPSGMIYTNINSNTITITDAAYDDWYVGQG